MQGRFHDEAHEGLAFFSTAFYFWLRITGVRLQFIQSDRPSRNVLVESFTANQGMSVLTGTGPGIRVVHGTSVSTGNYNTAKSGHTVRRAKCHRPCSPGRMHYSATLPHETKSILRGRSYRDHRHARPRGMQRVIFTTESWRLCAWFQASSVLRTALIQDHARPQ